MHVDGDVQGRGVVLRQALQAIHYEVPGAIYHIIARGDGGKMVFDTEPDRSASLTRKDEACEKFGWLVHSWVQMGKSFRWRLIFRALAGMEFAVL